MLSVADRKPRVSQELSEYERLGFPRNELDLPSFRFAAYSQTML